MTWTQIIDPLHNLPLSGLVAAVPIFLIFLVVDQKNERLSNQPASVRQCIVDRHPGVWNAF